MIYESDHACEIIPDDEKTLEPVIKKLFIKEPGSLKIQTIADDIVEFFMTGMGLFDPGCRIKKIFNTGTTAKAMIGFY